MSTTVVIAPQEAEKIKYLQQETLNSILISKKKCVIFTVGGVNTIKQLALYLQCNSYGVKEIKITNMLLKCLPEEIEEHKIYKELVSSTRDFMSSEEKLLVIDLPSCHSSDLEKCTFIVNNLLDESLNGEITVIVNDGDIEIEAYHNISNISQIFRNEKQFLKVYNFPLKDCLSDASFSCSLEFTENRLHKLG